MGMTFDVDRYVLVCANCGMKNPQMWQQVGADESCSACGRVVDTTPRDPNGTKVRVPLEYQGKINIATGQPVHSSHQYADYLKQKNYVLRG